MFWLQFRTHKVIYRRYAGLFFALCVDITDNELAYLECIHLFVEILDHFFSNVCELDLVFNFHKVCHCCNFSFLLFWYFDFNHGRLASWNSVCVACIIDVSFSCLWSLPSGQVTRSITYITSPSKGFHRPHIGSDDSPHMHTLACVCVLLLSNVFFAAVFLIYCFVWFSVSSKVYLILDEFILAGELQETSKRVSVFWSFISSWHIQLIGKQVFAHFTLTCIECMVFKHATNTSFVMCRQS